MEQACRFLQHFMAADLLLWSCSLTPSYSGRAEKWVKTLFPFDSLLQLLACLYLLSWHSCACCYTGVNGNSFTDFRGAGFSGVFWPKTIIKKSRGNLWKVEIKKLLPSTLHVHMLAFSKQLGSLFWILSCQTTETKWYCLPIQNCSQRLNILPFWPQDRERLIDTKSSKVLSTGWKAETLHMPIMFIENQR